MKKNNRLWSLLLLMVFLLTGYSAANAATEVEFGTTYRFAAFSNPVYSIKVAEAGTLTVSTTEEGDFKAVSGKINKTTRVSNATPKVIEYQVAAGTYTYSISWNFDAGSIKFEFKAEGNGEQEVGKFVKTDPVPGSTFNAGGFDSTFDVFLTPEDVKVGSVSFIYTDEEGVENTIPNVTFINTTFGKQKVVKILRPSFIGPDGKTNSNGGERLSFGGTEVKYVLNDVTYNGAPVNASDYTGANVTVENGTITLTFQVETAVKLVSEEWPALLSKNYPATPAVTGTMTFDGNVKSVEEVSVIQGKSVPGAVGGENEIHVTIPKSNVSISGKTITIDFAGVNLSSIPAGNATIMVKGVTGANGIMASFDGYSEYVYYIELGEAPVEFVSMNPKNNTEISISEAEAINFTVVYSAPVKIDIHASNCGSRGNYKFEASNADNEMYAKEWTLTFPASYVESLINGWDPEQEELKLSVMGRVVALDTEGNAVVVGDNDEKELFVMYYLNYSTGNYGVKVDINEIDEEVYGLLQNFYVLIPEAYNIIIEGPNFENITVTGDNFTATAVSMNSNGVQFAPYINKPGTYTINYPYGAFQVGVDTGMGQEGDTAEGDEYYNTAEGTYTFEIVSVTDAAPDPDTPVAQTLPIDESFTPAVKTDYVYTPKTDGILIMTKEGGDNLYYGWLLNGLLSSDGEVVDPVYNDGNLNDGNIIPTTELKWNLEAGKSYIFNYNVDKNEDEVGTFLFTFEGEEEQGDGYQTLQLNTAYAVDGIGSLKLQYTPEENGVLTATQTGSNESHLFTQEPNVIDDATGQVSEMYMDHGTVNGNVITYNLKAGHTYYVYAQMNRYDGIKGVTFTYEAQSEDDEYAIQLGQTYTVNYKQNPLYHYTATEDGDLVIQTSSAAGDVGNALMKAQYFMYTSQDHTNPAQAKSVVAANGGLLVKIPMSEGEILYLYSDTNSAVSYTFSWEEAAIESVLASVEPAAGVVFDYNTYYDLLVRGEGAVTSYGEITFNFNEESYVINSSAMLNGPEASQFLQIKIGNSELTGMTDYVKMAAEAGAESFTVVIKDLKVNNLPVGSSVAGEGVTIAEDGTVTITYLAAKAPVYLANESSWPQTFYNTWTANDDGTATLVFDAPIASVGSASVSMYPLVPGGDTGEAQFNTYALNPVISQDGMSVTLDFTGRDYEGTSSKVTVVVSNVVGTNGMPVNFPGQGAALYQQIDYAKQAEPEPALVADDFEMTFTKGQITPVTTDVYVSLENVENMYSYAGYQFDITLPFGMEVTKAALGTGIVGMEGYEKPISVAQVNDMPPTTYRVLGFFEPTTATENIAKLTISGVYNEDMVNGEESPVTIQNTVVFSTPTGGDKTDIAGSASTVTIYIEENLAEKVTIESCKLLWPSYTSREGDIEYITEGQAVELTATLEPTTAVDEITWTATVNGSDNLGIQVSSLDEDDNNLVAVISTDWELLNLTEDMTVVIRAQGENEDVFAEYELTVKPIVLGDANDNDEVNVADVVTTANYIANGDNEATIAQFVAEFDHPNADVVITDYEAPGNVNGITVSDVTAIVNIALGVQDVRNVRRHVSTYRSNDRLVAARVSDNNIAVALDGQTAYAALQVEIEMPAGMSVYGVEKGARAAGHELAYGVNASGNVVVVLYSLDNSSFAAGEGSLFTLQVEGGNAEDMKLVNIFASDAQSNGYELEGVYSNEVTGIFGIEAELASGVRYFTVDGVQVTNPEKGQILIRVNGNKAEKMIVK